MIDLLKDKLKILANDEFMIQAIKELLKIEKPNIEKTDTDKILGEKYRAYSVAKEFIDKAFINLKSYQEAKKIISTFNKER